MLRVIDCVTQQHDLRLVLLAGVICLVATNTAFTLFAHAGKAAGRARAGWLAATAVATGGGIWATHFVAMLAFKPQMPFGFDLLLTVLSVIIAISVTGIGFALAGSRAAALTLAGGAIVGLGVFSMHFTGMAALRVPATMRYDGGYVLASLLIGAALSALAMRHAKTRNSVGGRIVAASLLALGIVGLHFTAMAAVVLTPDPTVIVPPQAMSVEWLAVGVAASTLVIVAAGFTASIIDQRFAGLAEREAERLRATVTELQATKSALEAAGEELKTALAAADAANRAKSQFLAAMSHELRTPLNAVIGFADLLLSDSFGALGERQQQYAADIRRSGAHLLELVNNILDISRLDANALTLEEQDFDLSQTVNEAASRIAARAEAGGVTLAAKCDAAEPYLHGDAYRVRQIVLNLLSNAVKFTPAGGTVTVRVAERDGALMVSVADTGIGIAANDVPTALSPFSQVDGRLARKFEGAGLGLPLAKRLVDLHGGTIAIASTVGAGTEVTVAFPPARSVRIANAA